MPPHIGFWTEDRVLAARQMWFDGNSASVICEAIGATSRSAVCGMAERDGWQRPAKPMNAEPKSPRKKIIQMKPPKEPEPIIEVPINAAALSFRCDGGITILELSTESCRWPLGNPQQKDFRYCGADQQFASSYCVRHSRLCFNGFSR